MAQLVTRVGDDLVSEVDRLVIEGAVESRSDAVRSGLEALIDRHRRAAAAAAIVRGYEQTPETDEESHWSDEATVHMISEEPW